MRKAISALLTISLLLAAASCGSSGNAKPKTKLSVVTTIFAPYDFTRQIAGDLADIHMLLPPAAESHSFEPTPQDIIKIQNCDVFIYVGGDSDAWVRTILDSMDTSKMKVITLMDCVDTVEEVLVEGMEDDEDEHEHGDFDPANVKDRPMADFAGSWISGIPLIKDGTLSAYILHSAEESGITAEEFKARLLNGWACEHDYIKVSANTLEIGSAKADYTYRGYEIVESEHGSSVWYKYQAASPNASLPTYLMFNDHGDGNAEEEGEHAQEGVAHLHLKYGNEGFEALLAKEGWSAFYFDASRTKAEIGAFMAGHGEEEKELDEHVWTSPKNAKLIVGKISDALCEADPANADAYAEKTAIYLGKLDELDAAFRSVVNGASRKTIVFGDRFPFRYLADAYGLEYYAAFPGCSIQTEASAATVAFLIGKVKAEAIPVVFHVELSDKRIAETIAEGTGAKVLLLHACHNVSKTDFESGVGYLDLMLQNVENLKEALN